MIATGAVPLRPYIVGRDLPGVYFLRTMADMFAIYQHVITRPPRSAAILGGGFNALELADAFTRRGIAVTVLQRGTSLMETVDPSLGHAVSTELQRHGVRVVSGVRVKGIARQGERLVVTGEPAYRMTADLVQVGVGIRPSTDLARTAGLATGVRGAIRVSRAMATSVSEIYAAGGQRNFAGSLGTHVVQTFDLAIAATELRDSEARAAGFEPLTVETITWDHTDYYPDAHELRIRIIGDRSSGRLLGAQMLGHRNSEVAKRIDVFATALFQDLRIDQLNDLDLSYTPPYSSPWDPVQRAAQA